MPTPTPTLTVAPTAAAAADGRLVALAANASGGVPPLTYGWTVSDNLTDQPAPSLSNSSDADPVLVVFAPGLYGCMVSATDANGTTSTRVTALVAVPQVPTRITIVPPTPPGQTYTATVADQFGNPIAGASVAWSYLPGASVNASTGLYTTGTPSIQASSGSLVATLALPTTYLFGEDANGHPTLNGLTLALLVPPPEIVNASSSVING